MSSFISFIMAFLYSFYSFLGIPFDKPDLAYSALDEVVVTAEDKELLENFVETERAWLASLQLENGALPMTYNANAELTVNPYFSCYTALALLDDPELYAGNVKAYFDWHFAHLNTKKTDYAGVDGTIYDHIITVENGSVTGERMHPRKYDSSDAYAGVFLTALNKYYNATGDAEYIIAHADEIVRVVNAMTATMNNGLAYACPDYKVKYLMDNSEVYEGAVAATKLFELICSATGKYGSNLEFCKDTEETVGDAIERKLWNYFQNRYKVALNTSGAEVFDFKWSNFYPCATAQLFTISCGVIPAESERAKHLYNSFCESFDWQHFKFNSEFCWGSIVIAAAKMNDAASVIEYVKSYNAHEDYGTHTYPLYNGDAARAAIGVNIIIEKIG